MPFSVVKISILELSMLLAMFGNPFSTTLFSLKKKKVNFKTFYLFSFFKLVPPLLDLFFFYVGHTYLMINLKKITIVAQKLYRNCKRIIFLLYYINHFLNKKITTNLFFSLFFLKKTYLYFISHESLLITTKKKKKLLNFFTRYTENL